MRNFVLEVFVGNLTEPYSVTSAEVEDTVTPVQALAAICARAVARYNFMAGMKMTGKKPLPGNKRFRMRFKQADKVLLETEADFSLISDPVRIAKFEKALGATLGYQAGFLGATGSPAKRLEREAFPFEDLKAQIPAPKPAPAIES